MPTLAGSLRRVVRRHVYQSLLGPFDDLWESRVLAGSTPTRSRSQSSRVRLRESRSPVDEDVSTVYKSRTEGRGSPF